MFDLEVIDRHQLLGFREHSQHAFDCLDIHRTGLFVRLLESDALIFKRFELSTDDLSHDWKRGERLEIRLALVIHSCPLKAVTIR